MPDPPRLLELNHLYERLSPEKRDELLQGLLTAAPEGYEDSRFAHRRPYPLRPALPNLPRGLPIPLSLLHFAVGRLLRSLTAGGDRDDAAREIESLVLRHQLRVLSRGRRLRLGRRDRILSRGHV